jgi:hypothetical protein
MKNALSDTKDGVELCFRRLWWVDYGQNQHPSVTFKGTGSISLSY